jgi:hypothetical protein
MKRRPSLYPKPELMSWLMLSKVLLREWKGLCLVQRGLRFLFSHRRRFHRSHSLYLMEV